MIIGKIELISLFLIIRKIIFKGLNVKNCYYRSRGYGFSFCVPCLDNNHDTTIVGTHLENEFIDKLKKNDNLHPSLNTQIPNEIKIFKFEKFDELLKSNVDLMVLGISSKGIEWVADQLSRLFKGKKIPNLLMLTKGLSIYKNKYELLVDKLERLLNEGGISKVNISAVGGPCLATGLANRVHSSVVIANKDIENCKKNSRYVKHQLLSYFMF